MLANQTTKTSGIRAASSLRTPSFLPTHAQTRAEIDHVEERFFASRSSEHEKTREVWPVGGGPNDVTTLVKAMAVDAMEQNTASGARIDDQYERAWEKVAMQYPELANLTAAELEALADAYEAETGYDLADVQFRNPRTGRALGPIQNAEAQYRHGLAWARG